jgi:hypothetical protein
MSAANPNVSAAGALLTAMTMGEALQLLIQQIADEEVSDRFPHAEAMQACVDKLLAAVIPAHAEAASEVAPAAAPGTPPGEVTKAAQLANEMANLCGEHDAGCSWRHGEFVGSDPVRADRVQAELMILRNAIQQLGWMADRTSELLGGDIAKGGAEAWLLSPVFNELGKADAASS